MARPRKSRDGSFRVSQYDFSGGMSQDAERQLLPANSVYSATDWMFDRPGVLYKRGGRTLFSSAAASNPVGAVCSVSLAALGSDFVCAIDYDSSRRKVYKFTSSAVTDLGALPAGVWLNAQFTQIQDMVVITPGGGNQYAPQKLYNSAGLTLAALGGTPPSCSYSAAYKSRLVLGNAASPLRNRLYFSPVPTIETGTWDTTNSFIDVDQPITGLAALRNMLLVFENAQVERIIGDTPPPGSNMDRGLLARTGCDAARSIRVWNDNCVWANGVGVWITNGGQPIDLIKRAGLSRLWQSRVTTNSFGLCAGLYQNFYVVSGFSTSGISMVCDLTRNAWWTVTTQYDSFSQLASNNSGNSIPELYAADFSATGPYKLAAWWNSGGPVSDTGGSTVAPALTTRQYGDGTHRKRWGNVHVTYDLRDGGATPTLGVALTTGTQGAAGSSLGSLAATATDVRGRLAANTEYDALGLTVTQSLASTLTTLYGIELEGTELNPVYQGH